METDRAGEKKKKEKKKSENERQKYADREIDGKKRKIMRKRRKKQSV